MLARGGPPEGQDLVDLRRLQILSTLQSEATMTAAAEVLFMTTSAVSQQLALLEREAGVRLFTKAGRRVQLTDAGQVLVRHAQQIAAAAEAAEISMKRFRTDVAGTVAVSAFPSFASTILPKALIALRRSYPDLRVTATDLEPFQSMAELRAGRIDIAVIDDLHPVPLEGIVTAVLFEDDMLLCLPPSYANSPAGPVSLNRFRDADWVMDVRQSVFEIHVRRLCQDAGFEPKVIVNCSNLAVTLSMVETGVGVAILSRQHALHKAFQIVTRPIISAEKRTVLLACRASAQDSPLIRAVSAELKEKSTGQARLGASFVDPET
jgi:DNA-binding transcriptional LysR family regulator